MKLRIYKNFTSPTLMKKQQIFLKRSLIPILLKQMNKKMMELLMALKKMIPAMSQMIKIGMTQVRN